MPKRRRAALTMPNPRKVKRKVAKKREEVPEPEYPTPSKQEFQKMHNYNSFAVKDDEDKPHYFKIGCDALVVPNGVDPEAPLDLHEYWLARILEVRAKDKDPSEVWVRVQWYWSASHVNLPQNDKKQKFPLGEMELMYSKAEDFVHSTCFQGLADIVDYIEDDSNQRPIGTETFYRRYEYDPVKQRILPAGKLKGTCLCKKPYNPESDDIMHFCPNCRKSYHESCLIDNNWVEKEPDEPPREVRFERNLDTCSSDYAALPVLKRLEKPSALPSKLDRIYSDLPLDLLQLARSPIVRGGYDHGVVGNIFAVMRARTLIHDALMEDEPIPVEWTDGISEKGDLSKVQAWIVGDDNKFLCPDCRGVI